MSEPTDEERLEAADGADWIAQQMKEKGAETFADLLAMSNAEHEAGAA